MVSQIESERSRIRSAHNEELRALKDRLRALKDTREQDERTVKRLQPRPWSAVRVQGVLSPLPECL